MARKPWFLRSARMRKIATLALVADLSAGVFFTAMAIGAGTASAATPAVAQTAVTTNSAVTVNWTDNRASYDKDYDPNVTTSCDPTLPSCDRNQPLFQNLTVTVAQTQDLTDQGLAVSWTGGKPTSASGAAFDFLQIMECWASPGSDGPTPQQCQWGTPNPAIAAQTGSYTATRDLTDGDEADPKQDLGPAYTHGQFGLTPTNAVPFWSINDPQKKDLGWTNDAYNQPPFNPGQTNEVTFARTGADGTGQYIVNLQSALSAPYLGCGNPTLVKAGNSCYLVVVPRGEYNPNGQRAQDHDTSLPQNYSYVAGSPLSASVWQNRIQVKLGFTSIGSSCDVGGAQAPTAGSELAAAAFASWKAALCPQGTNLGYSQIGDPLARLSLTQGSPAFDFVASPVDPANVGDATLAYAPVATSSLVISYLIDKNYVSNPANPDAGANGTLVTDLKLSPLLVAKLLTQSYRADTPGDGANSAVSKSNPLSLRQDPEFLALNPNFTYFGPNAKPDGLIVPFGDSDAAKAVWTWLRSDSEARRFLGGATVGGVTINPAYKGLDLDSDASIASFPKADPSVFKTGDDKKVGYGTLDMAPYANNFADGARRTVTATSGAKTFWDITRTPPQFTGGAAQAPGTRFEMAITTSQAASLYGLPVATLLDSSSDPTSGVAPTTASMTAELGARTPVTGVDGVYQIDPMKNVAGGYPLTMQTYAAVNVCAASLSDLSAYAKFLDYAAGTGQISGAKLGQLPLGYAPLTASDRTETTSVAAALRAEVAKPKCASHQSPASTPTPSSHPSATPASPLPSASPTTAAGGDLGGSTPVGPAPSGIAPAVNAPAVDTVDSAALGITPVASVSTAARYAVLAAVLFAIPCVVTGPTIVGIVRRRR